MGIQSHFCLDDQAFEASNASEAGIKKSRGIIVRSNGWLGKSSILSSVVQFEVPIVFSGEKTISSVFHFKPLETTVHVAIG